MTLESANATAPPTPQCIITSPQREPPFFAGLRDDDADEWLDNYERVSAFNRWDDNLKRQNVSFSLTKVAETWYLNNRHTITDWADFVAQFRRIFGSSKARSDSSKKKLETRVQQAHETYTSYIEDVLALCRHADNNMPEADRVRHVLKGIGEFAFTTLATQNPTTVSDVISTCKRLDELQSIRLRQDTAPTHHLGNEDLRALIRSIIREEMHANISQCAHCVREAPSVPGLRDIVKEELAAMPVLPPPTQPVSVATPSYSDVAGRHPLPLSPITTRAPPGYVAAMPRLHTTPTYFPPHQDPNVGRPVCYYCGIRGHISRFCRRRQRDERRGYAAYERDYVRPNYFDYVHRTHPSFSRRSPSPPEPPTDFSRRPRDTRRRSPSPGRRALSPLRPATYVTDQHSEN